VIKVIRKYLLQDTSLVELLGGEHIYLVEKPQSKKTDIYIIYNYKPLKTGVVSEYQVSFNIVGKELGQILQVHKRLLELLDEIREPIEIKDEERTIKSNRLINGGGIIKNEDTGTYEMVLYFLSKI